MLKRQPQFALTMIAVTMLSLLACDAQGQFDAIAFGEIVNNEQILNELRETATAQANELESFRAAATSESLSNDGAPELSSGATAAVQNDVGAIPATSPPLVLNAAPSEAPTSPLPEV